MDSICFTVIICQIKCFDRFIKSTLIPATTILKLLLIMMTINTSIPLTKIGYRHNNHAKHKHGDIGNLRDRFCCEFHGNTDRHKAQFSQRFAMNISPSFPYIMDIIQTDGSDYAQIHFEDKRPQPPLAKQHIMKKKNQKKSSVINPIKIHRSVCVFSFSNSQEGALLLDCDL